jgi:hypothetical protein
MQPGKKKSPGLIRVRWVPTSGLTNEATMRGRVMRQPPLLRLRIF